MGRIVMVMLLGAGLFLGILYSLGMLNEPITTPPDKTTAVQKVPVPIIELGGNLYQALDFPAIRIADTIIADPIVLIGVMNAIEQEEVPSQVPGVILFIGDQVEDSLVLAAGSAAFITEPYWLAEIRAGEDTFVKFYRRLYDGKPVTQGQMVAMISPAKALGEVLSKAAKVELAIAERDAAISGEKEGYERYDRAYKAWQIGALAKEELGKRPFLPSLIGTIIPLVAFLFPRDGGIPFGNG